LVARFEADINRLNNRFQSGFNHFSGLISRDGTI
jgi:hypothetical protein